MYSLFIDTHSSVITVALINDKEIFKSTKSSNNSHSKYLMPMIEKLMNENNVQTKDLNSVLAVNGPGSFTGIRIGLSIAKMFSYCLNIPIKTISSLDAFLVSTKMDKKLSIIEDNKGYYIKASDINNDTLLEEQYVTNIDNLKDFNVVKNELDLRNIYDYLKEKPKENVHLVKANYVKKIEV